MEVALNDVSTLVRSWLASPLKGSTKPLPQYQPISPRPERLGLGANLPVNKIPTRSVFDLKVQRSVNGRRKQAAREREEEATPLQQGDSSDDDGYSRTATVGTSKKRGVSALFSLEKAQSRKRKRRRKKETDVVENNIPTALGVKENGDSTCEVPQSIVKSSNYLLDDGSQCNSASSSGGTFQLFVEVPLGSKRENGACASNHKIKHSKDRHLKSKQVYKRSALRGGSALCCQERVGKQQSHRNGTCEPSLRLTELLSNSSSSNSSETKAVSRVVGKQRHHTETLNGTRRKREPERSPTHVVDPNELDMSRDEITNGGDGEVAMERGRLRKRVTRCRRSRLITQMSSSVHLTRKLYLRKH